MRSKPIRVVGETHISMNGGICMTNVIWWLQILYENRHFRVTYQFVECEVVSLRSIRIYRYRQRQKTVVNFTPTMCLTASHSTLSHYLLFESLLPAEPTSICLQNGGSWRLQTCDRNISLIEKTILSIKIV